MVGHNKKPFQYAAKSILFRGLISCKHCGCGVTGDIKKKKYTYYSCTNSKRICKKDWVREEDLLAPLMEYLDRIQLPDTVIEKIVEYLKTPPDQKELANILKLLGLSAHALLRSKEAPYRELGLSRSSTEEQILQAICQHPILLERPIVVCGKKAVLGRPPENVLSLF